MSVTSKFWESFNETGTTIDEHFSDFAKANDLTEEEADAIRTDIVTTLTKYFAQIVEDIHQAEQADLVFEGELSSIDCIFDYFCGSCLGLEEDTKELLAKSIAASVAEFADEDDDDDEYKVMKFLKALVKTTPASHKDYIDLDQDTDETPDPYGNHFSGVVKAFDRRANRYGH